MEPYTLHISGKNAMNATIIHCYFYHWVQKKSQVMKNSAHQQSNNDVRNVDFHLPLLLHTVSLNREQMTGAAFSLLCVVEMAAGMAAHGMR